MHHTKNHKIITFLSLHNKSIVHRVTLRKFLNHPDCIFCMPFIRGSTNDLLDTGVVILGDPACAISTSCSPLALLLVTVVVVAVSDVQACVACAVSTACLSLLQLLY